MSKNTETSLDRPWAMEAADTLADLRVDPSCGLASSEVAERRSRYGVNALRELRPRSVWRILLTQFKSLLVALLVVAMAAAVAFGEQAEAVAIGVVLGVNALLGFVTELRATRSMEALRKMGVTRSTVRRDGKVEVVDAHALVPGDVVLLEGGDVVTADLRLVEASKLQANESTLTGESMPSAKDAAPVPVDTDIAERRSMLFKGTVVTRGTAVAVVVATGMSCELGQISRLVEEAKEETTPLERRLNKLGQGLVWITLLVAVIVGVSGYAAGRPLLLVIETALALAVAAVPEGLPVIATIALARGMHRMARHRALVNRLSAVETLGATSILCTDKTGTLTENRMTVESLEVGGPPGARLRALEAIVLCNNAELAEEGEHIGDPMEIALLRAARDEGVERPTLLEGAPEHTEHAFDPDLKMMATVHGVAPPYRVAVKGAPESVLEATTLAEDQREPWRQRAEALASRGLRVLGIAQSQSDDPDQDPYHDLEFLGLVAMHDPPRAEVRETIQACTGAGVRFVMVTGDHPITAQNIALATGLADAGFETAVLGVELEHALEADPATQKRLVEAQVFARVSPKQKLNLIALHQRAGNVVAMTGDGVNDAPALRKADIGVAMGQRGTAAAKEAASMVLEDDNLATIAVAIAQGRAIFDNIRRFVLYLLSCNLSEVLVVALGALFAGPLPLLPLQILFLNLVTDVFPALALGVGQADDNVMGRPPRKSGEAIVTRRDWMRIATHGSIMTCAVLAAFGLALFVFELSPKGAVTVSFLTLALTQTFHVFNMRRPEGSVVRNEVTRNPLVWLAVATCVGLLLLAVYVPALAGALSIVPPTAAGWLLVLAMSVLPVLAIQGGMIVRRARGAADSGSHRPSR